MDNEIKPKIIVSACLLGHKVRYDGKDSLIQHAKLQEWYEKGLVLSLCPEVLGGLPVPRARATIHGPDSGTGVLAGKARIMNCHNEDVTDAYLSGAKKVLALAKKHQIHIAILKENSPSCGSHHVYKADESGKIPGMGSTTAYLTHHGLQVFSENEIDEAMQCAFGLSDS